MKKWLGIRCLTEDDSLNFFVPSKIKIPINKMNSLDDLLKAAIGGDKEAENQLFSQLRARISNLVQYKLREVKKHPSEVAQDVEDIIEEIMVTMLQKYKIEEFRYGFMAWMNKIVWNKVGDYFRREQRQAWNNIDLEDFGNKPGDSPVQIFEKQELDEIVCRALNRLGSTCKEIIIALLEGEIRSYIAQRREALPAGTIHSRIHRCRERFMTLLKEEGFEL